MFIDSHCHIDFPDFSEGVLPLLENMREAQVDAALCVSGKSIWQWESMNIR
jgi:TatD DNase family protein